MRRSAGILATAVLLALTVGPAQALPLGARAVPLSAPTPDWYTPALHASVLAAGAEGVPLPAEVALPSSALLFTGIRPGSWMISPAWCTMNFVFGGGAAIGTAGHCAEVGDEVTLIMAPGVLVYIGDVVRSVDNGIGDDFALVEIRDEVADLVNPSMAIVAGPTGTGDPAPGDALLHVGHGVVVGTGGTPRAGLSTYRDADAYAWGGAASPGDSGSAVRHVDGEALGNLTHLVVGGEFLPSFIAGTSAQRMEQIAGMGIATADLVPDPTS